MGFGLSTIIHGLDFISSANTEGCVFKRQRRLIFTFNREQLDLSRHYQIS